MGCNNVFFINYVRKGGYWQVMHSALIVILAEKPNQNLIKNLKI